MIKKLCLSLALTLPLFITGCMEMGSMLILNKDGSGKIIARMYMNDGGLGGLGAAFGGEAGGEAPDPLADVKKQMENAAASLGEGVELESVKEVKNKAGWKGYEGIYTFNDVNKVKLQLVGMDEEGDEEDGAGGAPGGLSMGGGGDMAYNLRFTPGDTATLELVADMPEKDDAADAAADAGAEIGGADGAPDAAMMSMMAPMFAGMRMSQMIKVNGEITDTNAKYVNKDTGTVLVFDMKVDKLFANPEALKMMGQGGDTEWAQDFEKLEALNIEGLKIQNPTEPLKISFK